MNNRGGKPAKIGCCRRSLNNAARKQHHPGTSAYNSHVPRIVAAFAVIMRQSPGH